MQFENVDVRLLFENVFASTLGMTVAQMCSPSGAAGWPPYRASVSITGVWQGTVVIAATEKVLRATVAVMCHVDATTCSSGDLDDALRELTNIVGGGVKALLSDDCSLGLPTLLGEHELPAPGSGLLDSTFRCDGEPVRLWFLGHAAQAPGEPTSQENCK